MTYMCYYLFQKSFMYNVSQIEKYISKNVEAETDFHKVMKNGEIFLE